ncbi:hypothetical protein [Thermus oshimai]|jgi:hypothetical protein|uniref:hypothetical protein n=1 Tax=Thermus oshimai TaxID=56957 RepID=UPI00037A0863|nr:hypothetical protein [Thermus oshimai]
MQRTLGRVLGAVGLLIALAACSLYTRYRVEVDLRSLLPEEVRSGILTPTENVLLPAPKGQLLSIPGLEALAEGQVLGEVELTHTGGEAANVTLEVRVAPPSDENLFDGDGDQLWASRALALAPGETATLSLREQSAQVPFLGPGVREFRIGARLQVEGGQVAYVLRRLELALQLDFTPEPRSQ